MKPIKRSIAVVIRKDHEVLSIRRPDDEDELPGIWGLPAGTYRSGESLRELITRIGLDKLGVKLTPMRLRLSGVQERPHYRLEMELWETAMEGTPTHGEWKWAALEVLEPGAESGSLCCELAPKSKRRVSL